MTWVLEEREPYEAAWRQLHDLKVGADYVLLAHLEHWDLVAITRHPLAFVFSNQEWMRFHNNTGFEWGFRRLRFIP